MRHSKTIAFSILITLAALGVAFVATRSTQGYSAADKKTLKVLRKKDHLGLRPTTQEIAAQLPQVERELEDNLPKHLPLKVKVRNLKSEKWVRDFAVEVENKSDKPIYYLHVVVSLPDVKSENGNNMGFSLRYGRGALVSYAVPVESDDVPIKPGETYTLKIPEQHQLGWERFVKRRGLAKDEPKKLNFIFQYLNFGDGTGFRFPSGIPFDIHKRRRELMQKESERRSSVATVTPDKPPVRFPLPPFTSSTLFLPATFLPVNLSPAKNSEPTANLTTSSSDICCPGSSCQSLRSDTVYCCGEIEKIFRAPCSDPSGSCTTYTTQNVSCNDEFGTYCIEDIIGDPCPPPGPTPTPTSTPKATPTPSPTPDCEAACRERNPYSHCEPNNPGGAICVNAFACFSGPNADFNASQSGCPGNAYYDGQGCCVCVSENQTCQPGFVWNTDLCECALAPTPTPTPGGGGPGDGGSGGDGDAYYCTPYYWVYYESYDDGKTWREVDCEYAGCW